MALRNRIYMPHGRLLRLASVEFNGTWRAVGRHITRAVETARIEGFIVVAIGTWLHTRWLIPVGFVAVVLGWLRGIILPKTTLPGYVVRLP